MNCQGTDQLPKPDPAHIGFSRSYVSASNSEFCSNCTMYATASSRMQMRAAHARAPAVVPATCRPGVSNRYRPCKASLSDIGRNAASLVAVGVLEMLAHPAVSMAADGGDFGFGAGGLAIGGATAAAVLMNMSKDKESQLAAEAEKAKAAAVQAAQQKVSAIEADLAAAKTLIEDGKKALRAKENEVIEKNAALQRVQQEAADMKQRSAGLESQLEEAQRRYRTASEQLPAMENKLSAATGQLTEANADLQRLKASAAAQLSQLQSALAGAQSAAKSAQEEMTKAEEGAVRARSEMGNERVKVQKLQVRGSRRFWRTCGNIATCCFWSPIMLSGLQALLNHGVNFPS